MTYTIKQTQAIIRLMGAPCKYASEYGEFRIGGGDNGYYTTDRSDAIWTAAEMLNERENIPESSRPEVSRSRVLRALNVLGLRA